MSFRSEINRAAKGIKHASVLMPAAQRAKFFVKLFGIPPAQSRNPIDAQLNQVLLETGSDPGDLPKCFENAF